MEQFTIHYCDFNSVLLVDAMGKLKQLYTPFYVVAKEFTARRGERFEVTEVRATSTDELVYVINNKNYYHHQFEIELKF